VRVLRSFAGVRPATADRMPVLGAVSPEGRLHCFNGLGTRGSMVAPHWAAALADNLVEGKGIPREASVSRFRAGGAAT
jgi:glycine/D-amino acid oxidase-like deaminating enzyme